MNNNHKGPAKADRFHVALLHDQMHDKSGAIVTTSLTMIDVHDISRSARTFGVARTFIVHPSPTIRKLARTLQRHWEEGFGATYNPNRKEALEYISIVTELDEAIASIERTTGKRPIIIATSAKEGGTRVSFETTREMLLTTDNCYLMMLGTGWGMSESLLARADIFLEPVRGGGEYNHLSVRSACAIMLDRLFGS
jgi:hypothetical protein